MIKILRIFVFTVVSTITAQSQQVVMVKTTGGNDTGFVRCDWRDRPVIVLLEGKYEEIHPIYKHEIVHVGQVRSYKGGCHALIARYIQDPVFRFHIEAEAYCSAPRSFMEPGGQINEGRITRHLLHYYSAGYKGTQAEVGKIVHASCQKAWYGQKPVP